MRHLSDTHFKDRMCNRIPDQEGLIYKCPQCNHIARDRQSFVRHYGIVHKMVVKYLNEMGIHSLYDEARNSSDPQSPATTPQPNTPQYQPARNSSTNLCSSKSSQFPTDSDTPVIPSTTTHRVYITVNSPQNSYSTAESYCSELWVTHASITSSN